MTIPKCRSAMIQGLIRRQAASAALLATLLLLVVTAAPPECPGLVPTKKGNECPGDCQLAICNALVDFYNFSQPRGANGQQTWFNTSGWQAGSCPELVAKASGPQPAYCGQKTFPQLECCVGTQWQNGSEPCPFPYAPVNLTIRVNGVNGSLSPDPQNDPEGRFAAAISTLVYCGLRVLDLSNNKIYGSMTGVWGNYTNLRSLALSSNSLTGSLPPSLSNLSGLVNLRLDSNTLQGTIPDNFTGLRSLEFLNLAAQAGTEDLPGGRIVWLPGLTGSIPPKLFRLPLLTELNLQLNNLTGQLPDDLCDSNGTLQVLSLRNNQLYGTAGAVSKCTRLAFLDISSNRFQGSLPASYNWSSLIIYYAGYNNLSGTLPQALYQAPFLSILDVRNNSISGSIDRAVEKLGYLQSLLASNNQLTGSIPTGLVSLSSLTRLLLDGNKLNGTIPAQINYAMSLNQLRLNSNSDLRGTIPDSIGQLKFLERFELLDTNLTANLDSGCILPCFLQQDTSVMVVPTLMPSDQENSTALTCPVIKRAEFKKECKCNFQDPTADESLQYWVLDPIYYNYTNCQCLEGFEPVWQNDTSIGRKRKRCAPKPADTVPKWAVAIVVVFCLLGIVAFLLCALLACKRLAHKPSWLWKKEITQHRLKGPPTEGQVSIVVTDIEGYSDMMKASPQLMTKALGLHNYAIRKACHANAGHVLEQEGDSYSIAFHKPLEAVAFCLQVQLALQRLDWPAGLLGTKAGSAVARSSSSNAPRTSASGSSSDHPTAAAAAAAHGGGPPGRSSSVLVPLAESGSAGGGVGWGSSRSPLRGQEAGESKLSTRRSKGRRLLASFMRGTGGPDKSAGSRFWELFMEGAGGEEGLFNGLRVRMGVASGEKPRDRDIKATLVWEQAKVISDIGNGGQILLDKATFHHIKRNLFELGTVDHNGIDFKKLQTMTEMIGCCRAAADDISTREAVVLDMGQYEYAAMAAAAAVAVAAATATGSHSSKASSEAAAAAAAAAAPAAAGGAGGAGEGPSLDRLHRLRSLSIARVREQPPGKRSKMRLYQVLSPDLVGRAHCFVNKLSLPKSGSTCTDLPYFDAPGALHADLSDAIAGGRPERQPSAALSLSASGQDLAGQEELPAITMAFCIVEGGKMFVKRNRKEAELVQKLIFNTLMLALRTVGGGYLCRVQEGDFKYMVAFYDPGDALVWCVLVQELLMWQPWPDVVLAYPGMGEVRDTTGRLVFRGPRMKMGVCEGSPRSILPDHLGRADYHGASINQAARYMDAAAHGGMVVCEARLAAKVFAMWRGERLPNLVEVPDSCLFVANARALEQQLLEEYGSQDAPHQRLLFTHQEVVQSRKEAEVDLQAELLQDLGQQLQVVVVKEGEAGGLDAGVEAPETPRATAQPSLPSLPTSASATRRAAAAAAAADSSGEGGSAGAASEAAAAGAGAASGEAAGAGGSTHPLWAPNNNSSTTTSFSEAQQPLPAAKSVHPALQDATAAPAVPSEAAVAAGLAAGAPPRPRPNARIPFAMLTQSAPPPLAAALPSTLAATNSTTTFSGTSLPGPLLSQRRSMFGLKLPSFESHPQHHQQQQEQQEQGLRQASTSSRRSGEGGSGGGGSGLFWRLGGKRKLSGHLQSSHGSSGSLHSAAAAADPAGGPGSTSGSAPGAGVELVPASGGSGAGGAPADNAGAGQQQQWAGGQPAPAALVGVRTRMLQSSIKDFLLPCGQLPTVVVARGIGVWRFKGASTPLDMVQVTSVELQGRTYPAEPPKGKGNRVSTQGDGDLLHDAVVHLPDTATLARDRFVSSQAQAQAVAPRLASDTAGAAAGISRVRQMGQAALALTSIRKAETMPARRQRFSANLIAEDGTAMRGGRGQQGGGSGADTGSSAAGSPCASPTAVGATAVGTSGTTASAATAAGGAAAAAAAAAAGGGVVPDATTTTTTAAAAGGQAAAEAAGAVPPKSSSPTAAAVAATASRPVADMV